MKLEEIYKCCNFEPNKQQKKAIEYVNGPLYLPAGPGSGKTRVLLWRAVNLIVCHGILPEEIYLSTFTEKAALQLRDGLRALLATVTNKTNKPYDISRMYVGTVHSLCQQLCTDRRFSTDRHRLRGPMLLPELPQYLHVRRRRIWDQLLEAAEYDGWGNSAINEYFNSFDRRSRNKRPSTSRHEAVKNCISFFNRISEEVIDPNRALRGKKSDEFKAMVRMYRAYMETLENDGAVPMTDFALLQQKALEVLEGSKDAGQVFKHVIIDEYQDTNTVQERIFFKLASGHKNICVVGDDDQALYRFRGATVENFVEFPERCEESLGVTPHKIVLSTNYRSRKDIVEFYTEFMEHPTCNWARRGRRGGYYRVVDKAIQPASEGDGSAVIASTPEHPEVVAEKIASLVKEIIDEGKVDDPNQIAFLFPSLKSVQTERMKDALEAEGLEVYAPRAGTFLEVPESLEMFGLFFHVFGAPERADFPGADYNKYHDWVAQACDRAESLMEEDSLLDRYVEYRSDEAEQATKDYSLLCATAERNKWDLYEYYKPDIMKDILAKTKGLSAKAKKAILSPYFDRAAKKRLTENHSPFLLKYVITRATSLDWNVLDLFYQLCGFRHFINMFDLAENHSDEGPICNLSLISQYLATFNDEYSPLISGDFLDNNNFLNLFSNYLYVLFRLGESEFEDAEDPFPKGRIPFITVHQAKGLEFPVVVLANTRKIIQDPQAVEQIVNPLLSRRGEPLARMVQFDIMRMFYVALSRAKNLLVLAHFRGRGQGISEPFKSMLDIDFMRIDDFDIDDLPSCQAEIDELPKNYSYTGDFMLYNRCPRQYMIFRKYGFVPSRSQTMFFGSLVHQTLEDLHQYLIGQRRK